MSSLMPIAKFDRNKAYLKNGLYESPWSRSSAAIRYKSPFSIDLIVFLDLMHFQSLLHTQETFFKVLILLQEQKRSNQMIRMYFRVIQKWTIFQFCCKICF